MEVFNVFASMTLVDMISNPLGKIQNLMGKLGNKVDGLAGKMGKFALSMAPVAVVAASLVMSFGVLSAKAMAFESTMADVAKVVNFETAAELKAMGDTILDLSSRIPMAADGLGAIVSAAAQSGIAKENLIEFAEQAAKMGVAFDLSGDQAGKTMADWRAGMNLTLPRVYALADAVNHLSNNMNATAPALSEVVQRVGPLAMAAGLAETQVAALGAALLSAGANPQIAATALRKLTSTLVLGSAMSDRQAEAFRNLGFSATQMAKDMQTDAQGTILRVLQTLADKPKELQVSLLTEMFGEQGLASIAPLLANMGNLSLAFELVGDSASFAGSMEAEFEARSRTTENALQLLRNKLLATAITMGNAFLPAIKLGAEFMGDIVEGVRVFMGSPLGQWLLQVTAALSGAVIGVTGFAAAIWLVKASIPLIGAALAPLKATLLAISWPVWAVIGAFSAFYLAYKTNFGGFADYVDGIWRKISLVFKGVQAVISSMVDGVGEIRGELAQEIQAEGLLGIVTNISRLYYRITQLFSGFADAIAPAVERVGNIFTSVFETIGALFGKIGQLFAPLLAMLGGGEVTSAASEWQSFGQILGGIAGFALNAVATAMQAAINGLTVLVDVIRLACAIFTGDWAAAGAIFQGILGTMGESILAVADLFGFGDWLRESWQGAMDFLSSINLYESGAAIITTLIDGITGMASSLVESVTSVFSSVRDLLPFSDAKAGPLSELTTSGGAIMTTLGTGVMSKQSSLVESVSGVFAKVGDVFGGAMDWLFGDEAVKAPDVSVGDAAVPEAAIPEAPGNFAQGEGNSGGQGDSVKGSITITIGSISLPDVTDAKGFVAELQGLMAEYDGVPA